MLQMLFLTVLLVGVEVFARDFKSGLRSTHAEMISILKLIAPISLVIIGVIFQFCKQRGFEKLTGFVIGCVVAFSAVSLVAMIQRIFG